MFSPLSLFQRKNLSPLLPEFTSALVSHLSRVSAFTFTFSEHFPHLHFHFFQGQSLPQPWCPTSTGFSPLFHMISPAFTLTFPEYFPTFTFTFSRDRVHLSLGVPPLRGFPDPRLPQRHLLPLHLLHRRGRPREQRLCCQQQGMFDVNCSMFNVTR